MDKESTEYRPLHSESRGFISDQIRFEYAYRREFGENFDDSLLGELKDLYLSLLSNSAQK